MTDTHVGDTPPTPGQAPTVMVLGANGHLGRAAVLAFAAAGWQVWAHVRRPPRGALPAGVHLVQADALDVATLQAAAPAGLDVIVHGLNPDYTKWARLLPPQTAAVIALARATGATVMLPGNVYNFGNQLPDRLTEVTPFAATHPKAAQRIAQEAALVQAAQQGVRSIVIRVGDFLGDVGTWLDLGLTRDLARGHFAHMGSPDLPHAWAFLPDLAQVFVQVAQQRARLPAHAVLHYAGHTLTSRALQAACEAALGAPLRATAFPWWLIKLLAPVAALPRALLQQRYLWQRPHQLDEAALARLLGPVAVPRTPLPAMVQACLHALPPGRLPRVATLKT